MGLSTWTAEQDALLRKFAADNKSAANAALAIGRSRNAVLGRADRIGVTFQGPQSNQHRKTMAVERAGFKPTWQNGERIKRPKTKKHRLRNLMPPKGWVPSPDDNLEPVEPLSGAKTLMELRAGECKFPHGTGPYLFCSAPTGDDEDSYCPFHDRITHSTPYNISDEERQRRRYQEKLNLLKGRKNGFHTTNPTGVCRFTIEDEEAAA